MVRIGSSRDLIRQLQEDGWVLMRARGSHHHFKHPTKPGKVTVKHPRKDVPEGTRRNILRQAGLQDTPGPLERRDGR
ncbi:YcfA family protein [Aminomonas paucivorans DSM 12260]|uniref:YcfA family protein n=1 Tax=Aminomonas paucivorans DSM 12260 TaxID=584708 RepID=E3D0C6_9BACT|nr:YcfA family protein [Aminomonas paucivorans DSM 12260]